MEQDEQKCQLMQMATIGEYITHLPYANFQNFTYQYTPNSLCNSLNTEIRGAKVIILLESCGTGKLSYVGGFRIASTFHPRPPAHILHYYISLHLH